ncbi:MAG: hypothetical protein CMJ83_02070 [Planctomycetes bacterium]|nr:hypothetical protein [Planctomycetota bacterium]
MRFIIPLILVTFLLSGSAVAQPPTAPPQKEDKAVLLARKIAEEVATFRQLEWKKKVDISAYSMKQLKAFVLKSMDEELPDALADSSTRALRALRAVPDDWELKSGLTALLVEQIGGFYDPDAKQLRVIERTQPAGKKDGKPGLLESLGMTGESMDRIVMAHELVHALQDQHFGLDRYPLDTKNDDDLVTAISSVVEGDATLSMMATMTPGATAKMIFERGKQISAMMRLMGGFGGMGLGGAMKEFEKAPKMIQEQLMFPYMGGLRFCLAAGADGKAYKGVDACLMKPPLSTEQVLHPEKLLSEEPDWPQVLTLPNLSAHLGPGSKALGDNTLGELYTKLVLQNGVKKRIARKAAEGWDGDRYVLYARPDAPDALVWLSTWDSVDEATQFQDALVAWARAAKDAPAPESNDWTPLLLAFEDGTVSVVGRRGPDVAWLHRVPKSSAPTILRALFEETKRAERRTLPARKRK